MNAQHHHDVNDAFTARVGLGLRELDGVERAPDVAMDVQRRLAEGTARPIAEGSSRRAFTVLAALLAVAVTASLVYLKGTEGGDRVAAQDPDGRRLVYRVTEEQTEAERTTMLRTLQERLGVLGSVAAAGDGARVHVTLHDARDAAHARGVVEGHDLFAMRMLARADYHVGDVTFDLEAEREQLQAWLNEGGRDALAQSVGAIHRYRAKSPFLRWYPRRIQRDSQDPSRWSYRLADAAAQDQVVAAYDASWWNGGVVPEAVNALPESSQFLIELVAINLHEDGFGAETVDPTSVHRGVATDGSPVVGFALLGAHKERFGDMTGRNVGHMMGIVWQGEVVQTPKLMSRIPGRASIRGLGDGADTLIRTLRNPGLLPLTFERREAVEEKR